MQLIPVHKLLRAFDAVASADPPKSPYDATPQLGLVRREGWYEALGAVRASLEEAASEAGGSADRSAYERSYPGQSGVSTNIVLHVEARDGFSHDEEADLVLTLRDAAEKFLAEHPDNSGMGRFDVTLTAVQGDTIYHEEWPR